MLSALDNKKSLTIFCALREFIVMEDGQHLTFVQTVFSFNPNRPQSNKIQQGEVKKMR